MAVTPWELERTVALAPATPFTVVTLSANKSMFNLPLMMGGNIRVANSWLVQCWQVHLEPFSRGLCILVWEV